MKSTLIAAGAAVAVQPLVFAAWFVLPLLLNVGALTDIPWQQVLFLLFYVVIFSLAFVFVLGIPLFHLLRISSAARPRNLAIAGFVCGALPLAAFTWPSACAGCSSGATWHGRYVELQAQGQVTIYGWLSFLEGLLQFGLHGLVGALVFGFVWRRTAVQQLLQADGPASAGSAA